MSNRTSVADPLASGAAGALLGTFVGDALGMPFEGAFPRGMGDAWPGDRPMLDGRLPAGSYTDDTQMMIALAESLAEQGELDPADLARRFAAHYDPRRGYGGGTAVILQALAEGADPEEVPRMVFPEGSYGNGAAMRVAPVGVVYRDAPERLRRVAEGSASITHVHPQGREGAALQAFAVARALVRRLDGTDELEVGTFVAELRDFLRDDAAVFHRKLEIAEELLEAGAADGGSGAVGRESVIRRLGNSVTAPESVVTAIYSFLAHWCSFEDAVASAVLLGGDTDTLGAMTGAIAGAFHGVESIPRRWLDALETGPRGREHVHELGERLAATGPDADSGH